MSTELSSMEEKDPTIVPSETASNEQFTAEGTEEKAMPAPDATGAPDIRALNERIQKSSRFVDLLRMELSKVIVGQTGMVDRLLIGLLGNGHVLLEGVPGLAKTLAIKSLSESVDAQFSRIQFTPDLLPADLIGTMIYNQKEEQFSVKKGPNFANFVLADEINRAPAKVQSAL